MMSFTLTGHFWSFGDIAAERFVYLVRDGGSLEAGF